MQCLISESNDPFFNLASEEYLLKNSKEDYLMLYINEPCIVIGKHQNLLSEINYPFILANNIKLARRISGGGTVYHDQNNVNFSFLRNCQNIEEINFEKFTFPILQVLKQFKLNAYFSERHDILIDNKKISGNAMHVYRNRVLSHGTLLYRSDLTYLKQALNNCPDKYLDRSIKSVRSKVTNISTYLKSDLNTFGFSNMLIEKIKFDEPTNIIKKFSPDETTQITKLAHEKFQSWEWVYGYSPNYIFSNRIPIGNDYLEFKLEVEKGVIRKVKSMDTMNGNSSKNILNSLVDVRHEYYSIYDHLNNFYNEDFLNKNDILDFCNYLF